MDQEQDKDKNADNSGESKERIERIKLANGGGVIIAGIDKHTTSLNEIQRINASLDETVARKGEKGVVFLGEGSAVSAGTKQQSVEFAIFGGDQQAIACHAKELGVGVIDSWDLSLNEQLQVSSKKYGTVNAILWILSQSAIALRSQAKEISWENTLAMLSDFELTSEEIVGLAQTGTQSIELNEESVGAILHERAGFSLESVNENEEHYRTLAQVAYPGNTENSVVNLPEGLRQAALVANGMSEERNKRFREKVSQYSEGGKVIFISCGGSHVEDFVKLLEPDRLLTETDSDADIEKFPPFHVYPEEYTREEISRLYDFYREASPGFEIKLKLIKNTKLRVDLPPIELVGAKDSQKKVGPILLEAFRQCDPSLRDANWRVRFVEGIVDPKYRDKTGVGGDTSTFTKKGVLDLKGIRIDSTRIAKMDPEDQLANILHVILHEIFESDYWYKKRKEGSIAKHGDPSDPSYSQNEHEVVANARAVKLIVKIFPEATLEKVT